MPLTISQVRDDLLSKLGIEDAATATSLDLQDVAIAINGAMQMLQTAGQDYFTRQTIQIGVYAGTSIYPISQDVQAILGPGRWNNQKPLRALESQGQYDQYERIYNGGTDYGPGDGEPEAYWPKYLRQGSTGNVCQIEFYIAPNPTTPGTIYIDVVDDAPSYVVDDLDSTDELPVAQDYTESIFLPIARWLVTRSRIFARPELGALLQADADIAMKRLGVSGGFPNEEQPYPPRKTEG